MRRLIAGLAAVALSVLLSACFASETLLITGPAATPLEIGDYGRTGRQYKVVYDRGSWYRFHTYGGDGKTVGYGQLMVLNRWPELDRGESKAYGFAVQYQAERGYGYGVMVIDKVGRVSLVTPDCGDRDDRAIAEAAGGTYEKTSKGKGCRFTDAESLRKAMGGILAERGDYLGQPYRPY